METTKNTTLIGFCIENAIMPPDKETLRKMLKEAYEAGQDNANEKKFKMSVQDLKDATPIYSEADLKTALHRQQVNYSYLFKCRLKKIEGVFRFPEEAQIIIDKLNEDDNEQS